MLKGWKTEKELILKKTKNKMEKARILGISSEEYPEGRIDSFKVQENKDTFENLILCLLNLGFSESVIRTKIDLAFEHNEYVFLYLNKKLRVHIEINKGDNPLTIRFDTSLQKKNIVSAMEKYFQFPK